MTGKSTVINIKTDVDYTSVFDGAISFLEVTILLTIGIWSVMYLKIPIRMITVLQQTHMKIIAIIYRLSFIGAYNMYYNYDTHLLVLVEVSII